MIIIIRTIDHRSQRYDTVGDWWIEPNGTMQIRVSETRSRDFNIALAVHELVEAALCHNVGIKQETVDAFDIAYRGPGEPGDDPACPYGIQHSFATAVERLLIAAFCRSWSDYETSVAAAQNR